MPRSLLALQAPNITVDTGNKAKFKTVLSADPAANNEATLTVPANTYYKIVSASITCVQGITQTPTVALKIADAAGNVVIQANGSSAAISVSTTSVCNWFPGAVLTAGAAATVNNAPIPDDLVIPPGYIISTVTAGKGANTDLGVLTLFVVALTP